MYRVNGTNDWGDCSTAKYSRIYDINNYLSDPYSLNLTNTVFPKSLQDGKIGNKHNVSAYTQKIGMINQPDAPFYNSGDLTVKLFDLIPAAPYQVLETDYTSYSVVYSCSHFYGLGTQEFIWVFTRKPLEIGTKAFNTLSDIVLKTIDNKFNSNNTSSGKPRDFSKSKGYSKYSDTNNYLRAV